MSYTNMRTSWWLPVRIPFTDLAWHMSEDDANRMKSRYIDVEIEINFIVSPPDPSVGILKESFDYEGNWSLPPVGNYPDCIMSAIEKYLSSIDVASTYYGKIKSMVDSYYEHIMYPEL